MTATDLSIHILFNANFKENSMLNHCNRIVSKAKEHIVLNASDDI